MSNPDKMIRRLVPQIDNLVYYMLYRLSKRACCIGVNMHIMRAKLRSRLLHAAEQIEDDL